MKVLRFVHPDYETRGDGKPALVPGAQRVARMAFSVGGVIESPLELYADALNAYERVENDTVSDERRYTANEVAILAELFDRILAELDASLDDGNRPRGAGGVLIENEARLPRESDDGQVDDDRVFQLEEGERIGTVYPRMSLSHFREQLVALVAFLRNAAERKLEVAVLG